MSGMTIPKWSFYLLAFLSLLAGSVAIDCMFELHVTARQTVTMIARSSPEALLIALLLYFLAKRRN